MVFFVYITNIKHFSFNVSITVLNCLCQSVISVQYLTTHDKYWFVDLNLIYARLHFRIVVMIS